MGSPMAAAIGAAGQGVAQMLIVGGLGALLEYFGELGPGRRKDLARLSYVLLLPALMFTAVAQAGMRTSISTLLMMPLAAFVSSTIAIVIGYLASVLLFKRLVAPGDSATPKMGLVAVGFGNHGFLPLIVAPAVLFTNPFGQASSTAIRSDIEYANGLIGAYIIWIIISTWTICYQILASEAARIELLRAEARSPQPVTDGGSDQLRATSPAQALQGASADKPGGGVSLPAISDRGDEECGASTSPAAAAGAAAAAAAAADGGIPAAPFNETPATTPGPAASPVTVISVEPPPGNEPPPTTWATFLSNLTTRLRSPPVLTSALGMLVGFIPPLRRVFFADPEASPAADWQAIAVSEFQQSVEAAAACSGVALGVEASCNASATAAELSIAAHDASVVGNDTWLAPVAMGGAALDGVDTFLKVSAQLAASEAHQLAPLEATVSGALLALGHTVTPIVILVLGANVAVRIRNELRGAKLAAAREVQTDGAEDAEERPAVSRGLAVAVAFVRLVVLPGALLALVWAAARAGILDGSDDILMFIVLLETCTPAAMNLSLIAEIVGARQQDMATLQTAQYVACSFTMALWISLHIVLINDGVFHPAP